jgi:hypothetical protein
MEPWGEQSEKKTAARSSDGRPWDWGVKDMLRGRRWPHRRSHAGVKNVVTAKLSQKILFIISI